ncbi:hypothetical protein GLOIN_2v1761399 [Rhizophagus clarus]|uniref:Uncharacterized protein n=1 Tax=Rhizophagus clarus TaxID=94130 RepID=A0A8H3L8V6_9GLOM|nr:hypothetical protein GLOIN_2v1761399 [Rhizophagus clarus]
MDDTQFQAILNTITNKTNYQRANLFSIIEQLPDTELSSTIHLIANEYIDQTLYKRQNYQSLHDSNSQLEKTSKKLCKKNQALIRQTQSLGAQNQHLQTATQSDIGP